MLIFSAAIFHFLFKSLTYLKRRNLESQLENHFCKLCRRSTRSQDEVFERIHSRGRSQEANLGGNRGLAQRGNHTEKGRRADAQGK